MRLPLILKKIVWRIANEISLTVKHDDLGQFKIDVSKNKSGRNIDLSFQQRRQKVVNFLS